MANPDPSPNTRFQPGRSGNPGGRPKKPDIDALNALIESEDFTDLIARTWLSAALGLNNDGEPNPQLFRMLIEYRNGTVPKGDDGAGAASEAIDDGLEIPGLDEELAG